MATAVHHCRTADSFPRNISRSSNYPRTAAFRSLPPATVSKQDASQLSAVCLSESIRLAQAGDPGAFEAIYRQCNRRVYALCLRMLGDPIEAEDLVQEAFLLLFRKIHTFRGESAFTSWLHRLTANVVLMRFRKKVPLVSSLDEIVRPDDENGGMRREFGTLDLRLAGVFDRFNLEAAIEKLPAGYKSMFLLHDVHGYEHNEIAAILGCSIGNCKSQLHKARKRLRALLTTAQAYGCHPAVEHPQMPQASAAAI